MFFFTISMANIIHKLSVVDNSFWINKSKILLCWYSGSQCLKTFLKNHYMTEVGIWKNSFFWINNLCNNELLILWGCWLQTRVHVHQMLKILYLWLLSSVVQWVYINNLELLYSIFPFRAPLPVKTCLGSPSYFSPNATLKLEQLSTAR